MAVVSGRGRDEGGRESTTIVPVDTIGRDVKPTNATNNILYILSLVQQQQEEQQNEEEGGGRRRTRMAKKGHRRRQGNKEEHEQ